MRRRPLPRPRGAGVPLLATRGGGGQLRLESPALFFDRARGSGGGSGVDPSLLFCLGPLGGAAFLFTRPLGGGGRLDGDAGALLFAGARFSDGDLGHQAAALFVARLFGGGGGDDGEPRPLFRACVLDRGRSVRGQPGALFFARADRGDRRFRFEPASFLLARLLRGVRGGRFEPCAFFLAGPFGGVRRFGRQPCALFFSHARFGDRRFGLQSLSFFLARLLRRPGRGGDQPGPFLLAGVVSGRGGLGGDARPFLFARARGRRQRPPLRRAGVPRRAPVRRPWPRRLRGVRVLLRARARRRHAIAASAGQQRALLLARPFGRRRRFGPQPPHVFLTLALERLGFGLGFLTSAAIRAARARPRLRPPRAAAPLRAGAPRPRGEDRSSRSWLRRADLRARAAHSRPQPRAPAGGAAPLRARSGSSLVRTVRLARMDPQTTGWLAGMRRLRRRVAGLPFEW